MRMRLFLRTLLGWARPEAMSRRRRLALGVVLMAASLGSLGLWVRQRVRRASSPAPARGTALRTPDAGVVARAPAVSDGGTPPPGDAGAVAVSGRVVDAQGLGVEGARVTVVTAQAHGHDGGVLSRMATSDAHGDFQIAELPGGAYAATVEAKGYLPFMARWQVPATPAVVLQKAATVMGDVRDGSGQPIAGVRLSLVSAGADGEAPIGTAGTVLVDAAYRLIPAGELGVLPGRIPFPPIAPGAGGPAAPATLEVRSDVAGRYVIEGAPPGRAMVVARHPAYADARTAVLVLVEGSRAEAHLTMVAGQSARGRVTDERGPVSGAEIWLEGTLRVVAGTDGRFELASLPGPVEVEVRARAHTTARQKIDPAAGEVEIRLPSAAGRVTGVVRDEHGFPVANAQVMLTGQGAEQLEAISDARGEFSFTGASVGPFALRVVAPGHPVLTRTGIAVGEDVQVTLVSGGGVSGEVRDGRGQVPEGLRLTVADASGEGRSVKVDGRGRFTVPGLAAGRATLHVTAPGYLPVTLPLSINAGSGPGAITVSDVRIELVRGAVVTGVVSDRYGVPVAGTTVSGGGVSSFTDGAGRYRLEPLVAGTLRVVVGNGATADTITVAAGEESRLDLQLR
ncbi:MAG TPA: carboxypeptidase regulatory-like domain-containing protein [Polyangia bacterium]|jgi:hypothetical protein|nr:carboxypeptidase regulatory-like domain-containing protein [Polyangia bacterium]